MNSPNKGQRLLSSAQRPSNDFQDSDKTKLFFDYIGEYYPKKITLEEVAQLLNMSKVSFNRFIKKTTNHTFVDYLNKVRIDNASRLLAKKDYSILEVAYMCGFNNMVNFNRTFKKTRAFAPSMYRKKFYSLKAGEVKIQGFGIQGCKVQGFHCLFVVHRFCCLNSEP